MLAQPQECMMNSKKKMAQSQECMKMKQTTTTSEHDSEDLHNNVQTTPEEESNESDEYITIEDINITSEMNGSNRENENTEDDEKETWTNARYNLWPRPKKGYNLL